MNQPKPRGLAAVDPERRKEIARMGGKKSQANGTAYRFDSERGKSAQANRKDRQPK